MTVAMESGWDGSLMPGTYMGELMDVQEPALSSALKSNLAGLNRSRIEPAMPT
jgi:hypothetical protein